MKYFLLTLLLPVVTMAFPVPKELKDAVITVTTTDGKVYTFSANTHKVVRRTEKKKLAVIPESSTVVVQPTEVIEQRHTGILSVYGVSGQRGLDSETEGLTTEVTTKRSLGVGAMYQHRLGEFYLGAGGDTNKNVKLMFGIGL